MGIGGRSKCFSCGKTLAWYELVPVISFLLQAGRCVKCKAKISWQYPLVETLTGLIFVLLTFTIMPQDFGGALLLVAHLIMGCLLIAILVYDAHHKIIPDPFVYAFIIIAGISLFLGGETGIHMPLIRDVLAGPILFAPFALIWLFSKGRAMGFGDAKLAWGIGWALGLAQGLSAIILAFWIGAIVGVYKIIKDRKHVGMKSEIPFAPFLIIGIYLALWIGADIYHVNFFIDSMVSLR